MEILFAMLAIAHAGAGPAIGKNAVGRVLRHDLFVHPGHEIEVVRAEGTGDPVVGIRWVTALVSLGVDGNPVGVSVVDILMGSVSVGARNNIHAEFAAPMQ